MDDTAGIGASDPSVRHALVGPPDLWQMKRRFQIQFLQGVGLKPNHHLLDLGCGTLRGGIPLIEYLEPGHYAGVDVRHQVLEEGRRELLESGLARQAPQLVHCPRIAELDLGRRFGFVWAFAVLIHMDDAVLDSAIAAVARHLDDSGVFYATVNVGSEPDGQWQGFPIVHREAAFYADMFGRHHLAVADIGSLISFGHRHPRLQLQAQARQRMLKVSRA